MMLRPHQEGTARQQVFPRKSAAPEQSRNEESGDEPLVAASVRLIHTLEAKYRRYKVAPSAVYR